MHQGLDKNRIPKNKLKGFLDQNPRVLVSTPSLRFAAYRELRKVRENPTAALSIETEERETFDRPSFLGDYEPVEDSFEILSPPWRVGMAVLTEDEKYILTKSAGKVRLEPGSYKVSEI